MAGEPMPLEQALAYLKPADANNGTISLRAPKAREAVAVIAAEIAALQSRAFEDGARWRRSGKMSRPAFGSGGTDEWFRTSDGLLRNFPIGFEPNLGAYYGLTIDFAPGPAALAEQEKGDA